MKTEYKIGNTTLNINSVKSFILEDTEYIYRPQYSKNGKFFDKIRHKEYTFKSMLPYMPYDGSVDIDNIPYAVVSESGECSEAKKEKIIKSTEEAHCSELRTVQKLTVIADKEYAFYGSDIDCKDVKAHYNRLKLLTKTAQINNADLKITAVDNTKKLSVFKRLKQKFTGLRRSKKIILISLIIILLFALIISVGTASENDTQDADLMFEEFTTEEETTTEVTAKTTERVTEATTQKTTEATPKTTTKAKTTVKQKSGKTVYITPYGKKYHLSSDCAGKNAMARDYDDVKDSYGPCKKCAQ